MNKNCCIFNSQAWESEAWKGALMCVSGCRRLSFPGCRASRSKHRKQSTEVRAKAIAPTWSQGCPLLHCEVGLWGGMCVGLDEIVMWGTHEGVSVLWEETKTFSLHRSLPLSLSLSLSLSLCLSLSPFVPPHHVYTQQKVTFCKSGRRPSPRTESASSLILDVPASRDARNKCLKFEPPCVWYFLRGEQSKTIMFAQICSSYNDVLLSNFN